MKDTKKTITVPLKYFVLILFIDIPRLNNILNKIIIPQANANQRNLSDIPE